MVWRRSTRRLVAALTLSAVGWSPAAHGQEIDAQKAAQVKAAYLYNFAKFTRWPETAFAGAAAPLVIGVVGDEPFSAILSKTVADKTVEGRALHVAAISSGADVEALRRCHVLYVGAIEKLDETLDVLRDGPVLVVGEGADFARRHGMIGFVLLDDNIVFHINREAATRAGLQLSSKLLTLAKMVYGELSR